MGFYLRLVRSQTQACWICSWFCSWLRLHVLKLVRSQTQTGLLDLLLVLLVAASRPAAGQESNTDWPAGAARSPAAVAPGPQPVLQPFAYWPFSPTPVPVVGRESSQHRPILPTSRRQESKTDWPAGSPAAGSTAVDPCRLHVRSQRQTGLLNLLLVLPLLVLCIGGSSAELASPVSVSLRSSRDCN